MQTMLRRMHKGHRKQTGWSRTAVVALMLQVLRRAARARPDWRQCPIGGDVDAPGTWTGTGTWTGYATGATATTTATGTWTASATMVKEGGPFWACL